jgi:hypothetical protein
MDDAHCTEGAHLHTLLGRPWVPAANMHAGHAHIFDLLVLFRADALALWNESGPAPFSAEVLGLASPVSPGVDGDFAAVCVNVWGVGETCAAS